MLKFMKKTYIHESHDGAMIKIVQYIKNLKFESWTMDMMHQFLAF